MTKGFEKLDIAIRQAAKEKKLTSAVNRYQAIRNWEKAVGSFIDEAKGLTKAVDFKNGVLVVACLSKDIAYQIKLLAGRIINTLNNLIGKQAVFAIQVEV